MRAFMVFDSESGLGRLQRHTLKGENRPPIFYISSAAIGI